jgi:hypothetical protein
MQNDWSDLKGFKEAVGQLDPQTTYREFCACLVGVGFDTQFKDDMPGEELAGEVMDILMGIPEECRWSLALSILFSGGARTELTTSRIHEQLADAFRGLLNQTQDAMKQNAPADEVLEQVVEAFGEGMNEMQKRSAIDSDDAEPFIAASSSCFVDDGKDIRHNKIMEMKAKQFSREVGALRDKGEITSKSEGVNLAMHKMATFISRVLVDPGQ